MMTGTSGRAAFAFGNSSRPAGLGGEFRLVARIPGLQKTKSESNRRPLVRTPGSNIISLRGAAVPPTGWAAPRSLTCQSVRQPAVDGRPDDGGGEESEAEGDAHRAFAAALVKRDLGCAREPSGDQPVEPAPGFGDRRQQPGPGLGAHGPALRSFSGWADDLALAAAGGGRPGQIEPLRLGIGRKAE
jgi:hypothetical protein